MTKYYFVLGNNPTLSIAEISAIFPSAVSGQVFDNIFIFNNETEIDADEIIKKIGGTIKIGSIIREEQNADYRRILYDIVSLIDLKKISGGKFKFGISYYGQKKLNIKVIGMELKKYLKEHDINSRWVTSKEPTLSSVIVEQNKLISRGIEICLIQNGNKVFISKTLAVQPFKELSFRDYGRPSRDDLSGMLPPKLAQIMINLANIPLNTTILDPFCGSGTILTEAMLMGYKNLIGADISNKAIEDTEKNIKWIEDSYKLSIISYQLYNKNAKELSQIIKPNSIDAIITEPYLGPQRGKIDYKKIVAELEKLYSDSLKEFFKILKQDGRIVMVWPVFRGTKENIYVNPDLNNFKIINPIPKELKNNKIIKLTGRNTIIYGRPEQKIWREIVILQK